MARQYAQIRISIWTDPDFRVLTPLQQHAYFVLSSQARMSLCGVLDLIPTRIAQCSDTWTVDEVLARVEDLESIGWVHVDRDTQELWMRPFIRHDGVLKMPNVAQGMASDYGEVMSDPLRAVIERELIEAYQDDPKLAGWKGVQKGNPVLFNRICAGAE